MPEAEEVIVDVARHATALVQRLWQRARGSGPTLDAAQSFLRIELLLRCVFSGGFELRQAQPPLPPTLAERWLRRDQRPFPRRPLPATDGRTVWLPRLPFELLQVIGLQQAMRAERNTARHRPLARLSLQRAIFEVLEANAADAALLQLLPGVGKDILAHRQQSLQERPALSAFARPQRPLEAWVRTILEMPPSPSTWEQSLQCAATMADRLLSDAGARECAWLYRDTWTGELHDPNPLPSSQAQGDAAGHESQAQKSARLPRRPQVRQQDTRDEARGPGAWLIQTSEPLEKAEDPLGLQRPADRDDSVAADEYADAVAELLEARLVSTSGTPKEVLLSEDPPPKQGRWMTPEALSAGALQYPEWDYRRAAYRMPGATVHELSCRIGSLNWVTAILAKHQALLHTVQRQFESLRVERLRLHQQRDGEELDLNACIDARAELKAGAELPAGLYETYRPARRDLAVLLLVDVSGSTDAWIAQQRRVIDVEREALLLVAVALEALHERYSILGFSGEGPNAVTVRTLKQFEEPYGQHVALRIAGLEPERFTRAGAALRHASARLRRQPVRHRLLLMLSDGRPNDMDEYDGQYGVDDLRQAVAEARTSDINVFCLTVDRQLPDYLRTVFGASGYAVLQTPELLGTALLRWLQRLIRH